MTDTGVCLGVSGCVRLDGSGHFSDGLVAVAAFAVELTDLNDLAVTEPLELLDALGEDVGFEFAADLSAAFIAGVLPGYGGAS